MLHVALITVALATGQCANCGHYNRQANDARMLAWRQFYGQQQAERYQQWTNPLGQPPPRRDLYPGGQVRKVGPGKYTGTAHWATSLGYGIPRVIPGCVGQNCYSVHRPLLPGMPGFDYRRDFNYPWNQSPDFLPPSGWPPGYQGDGNPLDGPIEAPTVGEIIPPPAEVRAARPTTSRIGKKPPASARTARVVTASDEDLATDE